VKLLSRQVKILKSSTVYLTEPLLHKAQPKYYNCVIKIETDVELKKLKFVVLRTIEEELGRNRTTDKYASRILDIDILVYGDLNLRKEGLVIPDIDIQKRAFLTLALFEIEPELLLPPLQTSQYEK
jgi:2-amino-4-hydroxy-6-hydroxymethyldihydropteridine diphosphokinase